MSAETPTAGTALALRELEAEARYARERYQLYKARSYGSRLTSHERLRELERRSKLAQRLVDRAKADQAPLASRLSPHSPRGSRLTRVGDLPSPTSADDGRSD
jgi:hypothetical protein